MSKRSEPFITLPGNIQGRGLSRSIYLMTAFLEHFLRLYAPAVVKAFTIAFLLLGLGNQQLPSSKYYNLPAKGSVEPKVFKEYQAFVDDQAARKGTLSDVESLKRYGFNKFRFLSHSFVENVVKISDKRVFKDESTGRVRKFGKQAVKSSSRKHKVEGLMDDSVNDDTVSSEDVDGEEDVVAAILGKVKRRKEAKN